MGSRTATSAIRSWIIDHEDSWIFVVFYVGLAVVLSAFISLFWLVVLVVLHALMELVTHAAHLDKTGRVWAETLWAIKLDIGLILFAFALTLYLPFVFGVLGLSAAARGAAMGTRFLVIQRSVRAVLLSVDDAALVARGLVRKRPARLGSANMDPAASTQDAERATPRSDHEDEQPRGSKTHSHGTHGDVNSWRAPWGLGGWTSIGFSAISLLLILVAPLITEHTLMSALHDIANELRPW